METLVGSFDNVSVKEYTSADMDVTRATAATRVDENGLVNYAEVLGGEEVTDGNFPTPNTAWSVFNGATVTHGGKANILLDMVVYLLIFHNHLSYRKKLMENFKVNFDAVISKVLVV